MGRSLAINRQVDGSPVRDISYGIYLTVYTQTFGEPVVQSAKVFWSGRSQAIRLPKEFRVSTAQVYLKKTPEGFLVIPRSMGDLPRGRRGVVI